MKPIKQALIRVGLRRPPKPYAVQFERRQTPRRNAMATADMVGVGTTESVEALQSLTLDELAKAYNPKSIAECRRILRAKGRDPKSAASMFLLIEWRY